MPPSDGPDPRDAPPIVVAPSDSPTPDDEYGVLDLGRGLPLLSFVFFAGALASRFLVQLLPPRYQIFPWRAFASALGVPALAFIGLVIGALGLLDERGRGLARVAVFVNGVALVVGLLLIAAFFYILPDR